MKNASHQRVFWKLDEEEECSYELRVSWGIPTPKQVAAIINALNEHYAKPR